MKLSEEHLIIVHLFELESGNSGSCCRSARFLTRFLFSVSTRVMLSTIKKQLIYSVCSASLLICYMKDLKEGKKIRISEPDVLKKAGQLFTLRFDGFLY